MLRGLSPVCWDRDTMSFMWNDRLRKYWQWDRPECLFCAEGLSQYVLRTRSRRKSCFSLLMNHLLNFSCCNCINLHRRLKKCSSSARSTLNVPLCHPCDHGDVKETSVHLGSAASQEQRALIEDEVEISAESLLHVLQVDHFNFCCYIDVLCQRCECMILPASSRLWCF